LYQLIKLEEDRIIDGFHQELQKAKDNAWNDRYIKKNKFKKGGMVLLYDNKYLQHLGKFKMHWLEIYEINNVTNGGVVQLHDLMRKEIHGMVNGSRLKLYRDN
jgi:hypothetical protein